MRNQGWGNKRLSFFQNQGNKMEEKAFQDVLESYCSPVKSFNLWLKTSQNLLTNTIPKFEKLKQGWELASKNKLLQR